MVKFYSSQHITTKNVDYVQWNLWGHSSEITWLMLIFHDFYWRLLKKGLVVLSENKKNVWTVPRVEDCGWKTHRETSQDTYIKFKFYNAPFDYYYTREGIVRHHIIQYTP